MAEYTVEVLVATMNQENALLPEKMNIQSDAIIGNQCDRNTVETIQYREHTIKYLNFNERGVGLNRNNALMRATGDIVLFADDDMRYVDDYPEKVKLAFANHPDADVIIFNLIEKNPRRYIIQKDFKVRWYNFLRFGTARIAAKRKVIHHKGISFNICFGGGTEHANGEDNIFLASCLREGLKIYAVPVAIAELTEERASTWFEGYTKKYFIDKGVLYSVIAPRMYPFLCMQDAFRHKYEGYTRIDVIRLMLRGGGDKQTWRE